MPYTIIDDEAPSAKGGYSIVDDSLERKRQAALRGAIIPGGDYWMDAAHGAMQGFDSLAQMLARGVEKVAPSVSDSRKSLEADIAQRERDYQQNDRPQDRVGASLVRGVGQSLPLLAAGAPAVTGVLANVGVGALQGAAGGLLTPVAEDAQNFWQQKGHQALGGAATGGAMGGGLALLGKAISPTVGAQQKALMDEGVNLTPGQTLGGIPKAIEDRLAGFPIIGDLIQKRRFAGITDFNRAMYARALEPFGADGAKVAAKADVGNQGVAQVGDFLSQQYEKALSQSAPSVVDAPFKQALTNIASMLPRSKRADFLDTIQSRIANKVTPAGTITPAVAKEVDSTLKGLGASFRGSSDAEQRLLGQAYGQAAAEMRDLFARNNPTTAPMIRAADQGWAVLTQIERAAQAAGAMKDGIFTPYQLLSSIRQGDSSIRNRMTARGEMMNQDLAQAGLTVLPSKVPDSGTAGREAVAYGMGKGLDGLAALLTNVAATVPAAAMSLPYLPGIGPLITKMMFARPQGAATLADLARGAAPLAAPVAGALVQPSP